AVATDKFLLFGFHVSKAGNVNAVGAVAEGDFVFMAGHFAASTRAHVVIHEVVTEFAAGIAESVWKFGSGGIQENARGFQRGSAKEKDARFKFDSFFGLCINDAHAG